MKKSFHLSTKIKKSFVATIALAIQCNYSFSQNSIDAVKQSMVRPELSAKCNKPEWPTFSLRNEDEGALQLAVKVGADGKATEIAMQFSSGFPDLDEAAKNSLKKCRFAPGTVNGKPVPMLQSVTYFWIETGSQTYGPHWQKIIELAKTGNLTAIYTIAQLQMSKPETTPSGIELLKVAADKGSSLAQYDLALRYETGNGVNKALDLAEIWYSKAVESGDILAIERKQLIQTLTSDVQ
ncbi:TonB family protein [Duganella sp. S19_KUP01_CR8]|uniref:TonB family protein n=1 Tax=Duganella sp. S19_KUP01_CR8 TaxID=3025502 RepID=UPI002FCD6E68